MCSQELHGVGPLTTSQVIGETDFYIQEASKQWTKDLNLRILIPKFVLNASRTCLLPRLMGTIVTS